VQLQGSYTIDAAPEAVWKLLMDTTAIAACLPGCKELRPLGDDRYAAELVVGIAAITGSYAATVTIADKKPPQSYRLLVDASGRTGFVKGDAVITLVAAGGATSVTVSATADAGGLLARVGQRMMEGVAKMTMDKFFGCLAVRAKDLRTKN
jgi:carbon monoxide dehydrogenase subunit G